MIVFRTPLGAAVRGTWARSLLAVMSLGLALGLSSCSAPVWRTLNDVEQALPRAVAGSSAIITGEVASQQGAANTTRSQIIVDEVFTPRGLGDATPTGAAQIARGDTIVVTQQGLSGDQDAPAPILRPGQNYLLFLVAEHGGYQIYGTSTGIYTVEPAGWFNHLNKSSDGFLPTRLQRGDLK